MLRQFNFRKSPFEDQLAQLLRQRYRSDFYQELDELTDAIVVFELKRLRRWRKLNFLIKPIRSLKRRYQRLIRREAQIEAKAIADAPNAPPKPSLVRREEETPA
jgi:uncharacterized protein YihD (DUF1040 family)